MIDRSTWRACGRGCMVGLCLLMTMCGGAAQQPPASPGGYAPEDRRPTTDPNAPPASAAPNTTPQTVAPAPGQPPTGSTRGAALVDLERSERELGASAGDCATACRALASMERATTQICSLTGEVGDDGRCDDARRRLLSAKDRVRSACGDCPAE
jgi:hypothetical protein